MKSLNHLNVIIKCYPALLKHKRQSNHYVSVARYPTIEDAVENYGSDSSVNVIRLITEVPELIEQRRMKYKLEWQEDGYEIINE